MSAVSQREFAKHIGRSHVWVSKLVKSGKLPTDGNGKILLEEGIAAYEASQQVGYDANRAHGEQQRKKSGKETPKPKTVRAKKTETASIGDDEELNENNVTIAKLGEAFNRAKTAEKTYQAKLKEMEYKEAKGLLIPRDEVIQDAANTAEELRGILFSMPPRIAPLCEGKSAREIEEIIEDSINEALQVLQNSKFVKGATVQ